MPNNIDTDKVILARNYVLEGFKEKLLPLSAMSTDLSPDAKEKGDSVQVAVVGAQPDAVAKTATGDYTAQDSNQTKKSVAIDKHEYVSMGFTDREISEMPNLKIEQIAKAKGHNLAKKAMTDILSNVTIDNFGAAAFTGAAAGFSSDDVIDLGGVADAADWPDEGRNLIIHGSYYTELLKDPSVKNAAAFGGPEAIRSGRINGIGTVENIYRSNYIPANAINLVGLLCNMSALLVAMRYLEPQDEGSLIDKEMLIDSETGLVIGYRKWYDYKAGKVVDLYEILYGSAVGNADACKLLVSA